MQGWPPGISNAHGGLQHDFVTRLKHIGNALNSHQLYHIMQHYTATATSTQAMTWPVNAQQMHFANAAACEQYLTNLSDSELREYVRAKLAGFTPPPLDLELRDGQMPPAGKHRGFSTPAGLRPSLQHMLNEQIRKGHLKRLPTDTNPNETFISQGFCQPKEGRDYEGTDLPQVRLLFDGRQANAACKGPPWHHYESCPTQANMASRVPLGSKYFCFYDLSDAFHTCNLTERAQKLLTVQFDNELYQYCGGPQGVANMATHWNAHLESCFNQVLDHHWHSWWTSYVDDIGTFGMTAAQARARGRILEVILEALGKPFSDKTKGIAETSMVIAGLHFNEHGVRLSDDAIESLKKCLREYEVKNVRDIQHVVGVIQYCSSAFEWEDRRAKTEYVDLISTLNAVIKEDTPKKIAAGLRSHTDCCRPNIPRHGIHTGEGCWCGYNCTCIVYTMVSYLRRACNISL